MAWIARAATGVGLLLLGHACYSAQEHTALQSTKMTAEALPLDISIEAILATFTIALGLVLGTPSLRPVQWHVWAGNMEREGDAGAAAGSSGAEGEFVGNPFRMLETRPSFVDIRKHRKEFSKWTAKN